MINRIEYNKFIGKIKGNFVLDVFKIEELIHDFNADELSFMKKEYKRKIDNLSDTAYPITFSDEDVMLHKKIFNEEIEVLQFLVRNLTIYIRMIYISRLTSSQIFQKDKLINKIDYFKRKCDLHYLNYEKRVLGYDD